MHFSCMLRNVCSLWFSLLSRQKVNFGPRLWTAIDEGLLKLNIWCVTWKTGSPTVRVTSVVPLFQGLISPALLVVCVRDGVFPLCLALIKLEVSRLFPLLFFCAGEKMWSSIKSPISPPAARAAISTSSRATERLPHADLCRDHLLVFLTGSWAETERRAQVVREPSVKLGPLQRKQNLH